MRKIRTVLCTLFICALLCFSVYADVIPPMTYELDGTTVEHAVEYYVFRESGIIQKTSHMEKGGTIPAGSTIFFSDELYYEGETYGFIRQIDYADGRTAKLEANSCVRMEDLPDGAVIEEPDTGIPVETTAAPQTETTIAPQTETTTMQRGTEATAAAETTDGTLSAQTETTDAPQNESVSTAEQAEPTTGTAAVETGKKSINVTAVCLAAAVLLTLAAVVSMLLIKHRKN